MNTIQAKTINKIFILFITVLLTSACSESDSEDTLSISEPSNISEKIIDASKIALVKANSTHKAVGIVTQQSTVAETGIFNATGEFTYPESADKFSGNISVSVNVSDQEGIKQVLLGFVGSDLTLPICEQDCSNQFSAFVNAINPTLFGLSSGSQTLTLWVEDNDNNLSQVASINVDWTELVVADVTASINTNTEELTVSWNPLSGALRYNVYLSNDVNLTHQNYFELIGGEAKLALTSTSVTFAEKAVNANYYILVSAVDGSGESAFSDKVALINGTLSSVLVATDDNFTLDEDQILTDNLLTNDIGQDNSITAKTEAAIQPSNGSVVINTNGVFSYTPNLNFNGLDQFSYTIEDPQGVTSTADVTITIIAINDSPILTGTAPTSATEDVLYTYTPTVSDVDDSNNGRDLTWSLTNSPEGMEISSTGKVTWAPTEGQLSSGNVTITVVDGGENGSIPATQNFTINVNSVNDAPTFLDGNTVTVYVDENSPSNTQVYTLLVDDPDVGAELTYNLPNGDGVFQLEAKTGTLYVSNASLLNYESKSSYVFDISVRDEFGLSDTITVTVKVNDIVENTEYILDTSFSDTGIANFNTYADTESSDYLVDAISSANNSRFVLSVGHQQYINYPVYTISKLHQDGTFDLSFGNNGIKHIYYDFDEDNLDPFEDSNLITTFEPTKIKIDDTNNKVYLLGYQSHESSTEQPFLLRLNYDGSIDTSFSDDGKYEHLITATDDHSEAVDLIIHSINGFLYLASSSRDNSSEIKSFKLDKIDSSGGLATLTYSFDLLGLGADEYIVSLVENNIGDLIAVGYADIQGQRNIIASKISQQDLSFNPAIKFNLGDMDTLSTYKIIDGNHILIGGKTDADTTNYTNETGELNGFIAKLNISSLELDNTFGGTNGYYIDTSENNYDDDVISVDIDSSGNIAYISRVDLGDNIYKLFVNQLNNNGVVTSLGNTLKNKELTNPEGSGLTNSWFDSGINATVLFDQDDSTNTINIFSSFEKQNYNPSTTPLVYNTEIETYYQRIAPDVSSLPALLGQTSDRIDYDFQYIESLGFFSNFIHSSGAIFTTTSRANTSYSNLGQTTTSHNINTGQANQDFGRFDQLSIIKGDADIQNNIEIYYSTAIEINQKDVNGFNYLMSAELINDNYHYLSTLRVTKFDVNGKLIDSYIVDTDLNAFTLIAGSTYDEDTSTMFLFSDTSLIRIQLNDYTPENMTIDEFAFNSIGGLLSGNYKFTSAIVQNDNSIIALGTGIIENTDNNMPFLVKINTDGSVDSTFDNFSADAADDEVLSIDIHTGYSANSGKLIQLSDSSLIYSASNNDGEAFLVKLIDSSPSNPDIQEYVIDANFKATPESSEAGIITLDLVYYSEGQYFPSIEIMDFTVTESDKLIIVGKAEFELNAAGFIAKFDGTTGAVDTILGNNNTSSEMGSGSGYYIPNAAIKCNYLLQGQGQGQDQPLTRDDIPEVLESELCSITAYDKVTIADDGSIIVHALLQSLLVPSINNSAILKFKEQQNDNAAPYTISTELIP